MNARATASIFSLLAAAALAGMPPAASAFTDRKLTNGAECQPYSSMTLPSELSFRANGLKNISTTAEYVVCNIMVDTDAPATWTDASPASLTVALHAVAPGIGRCEVYVGSNLLGTPVSYIQSMPMEAAGTSAFLVGDLSASGVQSPFSTLRPVSLYCRIPPGASIVGLQLSEPGATD